MKLFVFITLFCQLLSATIKEVIQIELTNGKTALFLAPTQDNNLCELQDLEQIQEIMQYTINFASLQPDKKFAFAYEEPGIYGIGDVGLFFSKLAKAQQLEFQNHMITHCLSFFISNKKELIYALFSKDYHKSTNMFGSINLLLISKIINQEQLPKNLSFQSNSPQKNFFYSLFADEKYYELFKSLSINEVMFTENWFNKQLDYYKNTPYLKEKINSLINQQNSIKDDLINYINNKNNNNKFSCLDLNKSFEEINNSITPKDLQIFLNTYINNYHLYFTESIEIEIITSLLADNFEVLIEIVKSEENIKNIINILNNNGLIKTKTILPYDILTNSLSC